MESYFGDSIILKNGRLKAEIALPGTYYKGSRFDWNGFVTQVTLDDVHTFCIPESLIAGKGSGGCGLCGEFGIHEPIGYDDAAVGSCFPKIGVGNILKCDESAYNFFRKYDFEPYKTITAKYDNSAEFRQEPTNCNGYSFSYVKNISLEGPGISIEYSLKNTGLKSINTTEYCHNFIGIDGGEVGRGYTLRLPYKPVIENLPLVMECNEDGALTWKDEGWQKDFYCIIKGYGMGKDHFWDLHNYVKGVGVREYDDFEPARFALWGMKHVISPEVFIDIRLSPGEEMSWTRRYEFYIKSILRSGSHG